MSKIVFNHDNTETSRSIVSTYNLTPTQREAVESALRPKMPDKIHVKGVYSGLTASVCGAENVVMVQVCEMFINITVEDARRFATRMIEFADAIDAGAKP